MMTDADRKYYADRLRALADALEAFMTPEEAAVRLQVLAIDLGGFHKEIH